MDIVFVNYIKSVLKMLSRAQVNIKMVQALTILSALQLFSEGVPGAEGSGEPYGISRGVVEGAARAGSVLNPQNTRELDLRPGVPALSQVSQESAPSHLDSNRPISSQGDAQKPEMPSCNRGQGVLRYERLSDVQLARSSSDTDIVRLSEIPSDVIFKCQDFCLKDRTSQSLPQLCGSFDFVPGKRFSSKIEYTESKCFLAMPEDTPGKLPQYKIAKDYYHYREVCYSGDGTDKPTVATDCPDRFYVMERVMGKRFMPKGAREVNANSLEECQQMCLNQATEDPLMATSICRAGTFDHRRARCYLSTYTRRTHPNEFIDDSIFDYFENSCLDVERRCPEGKLFWTKEVNAEMIGPYDTLLYQNLTVEECKTKCLSNANIYCRSIEYDERSKTCVLSDEDSVSRPEHIRQSLSDQNIYLELTCIDGYNMEPVNTISPSADQRDRQPLSDRNLRKVQTAFQLFRKRKLALSPGFKERGREGTKVSLAECLDACLEERSFVCRSAIYSQSQQLCRLSEFDRVNGNLVMDFDFDYFENLMSGSNPADSNFPGSRPFNFDSNSGRFRPINFDTDNRNTNNFVSGSRFDGSNNQFYDSGSGFSSGGGGFSSSGSRYDNSGSGFGSFSSSGAGGFGTSSDSRFGTADSDRLGGGNVGNSFVSREDRFSNAFNRFHEDNINRGSSGADTDRFGFGTTGNRVGGSGPFESSGAASGFGGTSGSFGSRGTGGTRVTGVDRFAGGTSGSVFGAGVQSSGADVGSLRGGGIGGGSRFSDNNRFSGNSFSNSRTSSFGFGPAFGSDSSSSFGASGFTNNFGTGSSQFGLGRPGFGGPGATNGIIDDNFQESHDRSDNFGGRLPGSASYGAHYNNRQTFDTRPGFATNYDPNRHTFDSGIGFGIDTRPHPPPVRPPPNFGVGNSLFDFPGGSGGFGLGSGDPGFVGSGSQFETFEPVGSRLRLRAQYVRKYYTVNSLNECKEECLRERSFTCRSFNYRYVSFARGENCELSDRDTTTLDLRNPSHFEPEGDYDYFERHGGLGGGVGGGGGVYGGGGFGGGRGDLDVSQQCNPDGSMEFMLRTVDAFRGRVYTFGYYDKCFYRGGGSTINVLKISPPRGFPDCGTSRYGDTTTNIVVVQFADGVMTSKDKRYNLTCTTVGPGDTVVTSAYIGAGIGAPIPIEYLPEESRLDSQVRLQILYSGRPTTTVAVGDPLTFRIESLAGRGFVSDIFATDVVARDLLTGRAIELIDGRGCPVQEEIFPALGKARSGDGLETRFSAFKIPESNMIVFEARVRMCRRECDPAICNVGRGRAEVYSYGKRRRRSAEGVGEEEFDPSKLIQGKNDANSTTEEVEEPPLPAQDLDNELPKDMFSEEEAKVNEVIRVYMNEDEAEEFRSVEAAELVSGVCISPSEYYSLIAGLMVCVLLLLASFFVMALCYRRHKKLAEKNAVADESNPRKHRSGFPGSHPRTVNQPARYFPSIDDKSQSNYDHDLNVRSSRENRFADPSEPIYTDPNLFERSPKDPTTSCTVKL